MAGSKMLSPALLRAAVLGHGRALAPHFSSQFELVPAYRFVGAPNTTRKTQNQRSFRLGFAGAPHITTPRLLLIAESNRSSVMVAPSRRTAARSSDTSRRDPYPSADRSRTNTKRHAQISRNNVPQASALLQKHNAVARELGGALYALLFDEFSEVCSIV
jgi:hypothetical protein